MGHALGGTQLVVGAAVASVLAAEVAALVAAGRRAGRGTGPERGAGPARSAGVGGGAGPVRGSGPERGARTAAGSQAPGAGSPAPGAGWRAPGAVGPAPVGPDQVGPARAGAGRALPGGGAAGPPVRVGRLAGRRRVQGPPAYISPGRPVRGLDGMRAISVLAILAYHLSGGGRPGSWDPLRPSGGFLGVDVFFVLSGFLITSLLLEERDRIGRTGYLAFYGRRARRLLPALGLTVAASVVLLPILARSPHGGPDGHYTLTALPWVIFYVGNWREALGFAPSLGLLSQTWSLSVEEQYYLVFPVLLAVALRVLRRRWAVAVALTAVAVGGTLWLEHLTASPSPILRTYEGSDTRSPALFIGAALAVVLSEPRVRAALEGVRARLALRAVGVLGAAATVWLLHWAILERSRERVALPGVEVATVAIVLAVVAGGPGVLGRALGSRPLVWVGRRSYGIYLYGWVAQMVALAFVATLPPGLTAAVVAATFAVAALSYRLVEVPILRRGSRPVVVPAPAGAPSDAPPRVASEVAVPATAAGIDGGRPTVRRIKLGGPRPLVGAR